MRTIMISDQAYEKLASMKGGKSFTELLTELANSVRQSRKSALLKFAGIMSKDEAEELQAEVSEIRKGFKART